MSLILAAACIASVHDGDTVRLCSGERVRLAGIDAPECKDLRDAPRETARALPHQKNPAWCDAQLGRDSRDALRTFLGSGNAKIQRTGTDRYGRTLATVYVNGRDAGQYLIARGLAKPWR
ncbi:thermonuclease family protein [Novosphingobium sp. 11B]